MTGDTPEYQLVHRHTAVDQYSFDASDPADQLREPLGSAYLAIYLSGIRMTREPGRIHIRGLRHHVDVL